MTTLNNSLADKERDLYGTVSGEQNDILEAQQMWDLVNEKAGNGMAEVRDAVMVRIESTLEASGVEPSAVTHGWVNQ